MGDFLSESEFDGNDSIVGNRGDDVLDGGGGNDTILGGEGEDNINARSGNDTIDGGNNADTISGDGGADSIQGGAGKDQLWGGPQNDSILGGGDADTIKGDDGCDTLYGDAGADSIDGGSGDDSGHAGSENSKGDGLVVGGSGKDTLEPYITSDPDASETCPAGGMSPLMLEGGPVLLSDNVVGYRDQRISLAFLAILGARESESYLRYYRMSDEELAVVRRWRNLFLAGNFGELAGLWTGESDCGCGDWSM